MKCSKCDKEGKERKERYWNPAPFLEYGEEELEKRDYGVLCDEHFIEALKEHIVELLVKLDPWTRKKND